MPNIRTYEAPQGLGLTPTETGIDATVAAARRTSQFYNQKADALGQEGQAASSTIRDAGEVAVKYEDHREISQGAATFAQLTANLTDERNKFVKNADPNDTSVISKFNEQVLQPALDTFQSRFSTEASQAWAEQHADALRQHMFTQGAADLSSMAADAVAVNIKRSENAWTNTARSDPSSTQYLLDQADHSVGALISSSPNLSPSDAAKVKAEGLQKTKEAIVKAGALGAMEKSNDPEAVADTFAKRYPDFINGQEIDQFAKAAKYYSRLNTSESRSDQAEKQRQAKDDFNTQVNKLEASTMPVNAGARPQLPPDYWDKLRDLAIHPGAALEPGRLRTMVENGERLTDRLNKPEPIGPVSHATTMDLLGKIRAQDATKLTSNDEIYKAYGDGKLNTSDFNFLQKEYQDRKTPEGEALAQDRTGFFKNYSKAIAGDSYDPKYGDPKLYSAEMAARRQEGVLRSQGKDPHLVYDPTSEYFFGKPANLQKFSGTLQGDLQTKATTPAAPESDTAKPSRPEVPFELRGIADVSYNRSKNLWRDNASGKIYDGSGKEVGK